LKNSTSDADGATNQISRYNRDAQRKKKSETALAESYFDLVSEKKAIGSIWAHAVFQKPLKTSYDVRFSGQLLPE